MKVKVNGVEIYYQKLGKGHPLIFVTWAPPRWWNLR